IDRVVAEERIARGRYVEERILEGKPGPWKEPVRTQQECVERIEEIVANEEIAQKRYLEKASKRQQAAIERIKTEEELAMAKYLEKKIAREQYQEEAPAESTEAFIARIKKDLKSESRSKEDPPEGFFDELIGHAELIQNLLLMVGVMLTEMQKYLDLLP